MILTLDVGNSQIFGGVFDERRADACVSASRPGRPPRPTNWGCSCAACFGRTAAIPRGVEQIALCSVVPEIIYSLRSCCRKYFGLDPFILQAGVKTGLKIRYRNPLEVGPDRIANAIGAHASVSGPAT